MVLLDFTGSDWCGWCKKLKAEVFSTDDFANYAKTNLVLVEVDFPRNKQLSAAQTTANMALQAKYGVQGYPTIIVLNSQGTKVAQLGYQPGGPKPFLAQLDRAKSQK
jgi:thioredoxin-related protein